MTVRSSTASPETSSARPLVGALACVALLVAVVVGLSFDGGSSTETTSVAAVLIWWTLLLAVGSGIWPVARIPRAALVCAGLIGLFTLWTGLSIAWGPSAERALAAVSRTLLYLGVYLLAVVAVPRWLAGRWVDGIAAGIAVVGALALAQRLIPGFASDGGVGALLPSAAPRLSYPLGYWNGLGMFLALGVPLLVAAAITPRPALLRGLAVVPIPIIACAIYLTSSRGAVAVALAGLVVFLLVGARRFAALQALAVAGAGTAVAIAVLRSHPQLIDGPVTGDLVRAQGPGTALAIVAIALITGVIQAVVARFLPARIAIAPTARRVLMAGAVVVILAGVVAADPAQRVDAFKAPPADTDQPGFVQAHLFSGGGSGRWQFWTSALDEFRNRPLLGGGAGSFEPWWAQHGSLVYFVRNAHSLWLETLAELGTVGALLLAGAFAVGVASSVARRRDADDEGRIVLGACAAVIVAFAVGAALDWIWQLPVVAMVAMAALGIGTGPATRDSAGAPARAGWLRGAVVIAAGLAIVVQGVLWAADVELRRSRAAAARGDLATARDSAANARAIAPWAASPALQLALVDELGGDLRRARGAIDEAIERDPTDWRLRIVATRLYTKAGAVAEARAQLRRARALNPRSVVFAPRPGQDAGAKP